MKVTVAICTWNRSASLRRTLESIADMQIPDGIEWELLVINNNSNDDTDSVVDSFSDRLPTRRILERAQGVSNGRNSGAKAARGEYIVWTDDDVIVGSRWLAAYCSAFDRWPDAAIFGGPVHPKFDEPIPRWLEHGWKVVPSAFAAVDFGSAGLPLSSVRLPYGANFALRRAAQLQYLYDPLLGPNPNGRYYAEETTLMLAMLDGGAEGWWVPEAPVRHCIPRERMTVKYIKSYFERTGRTDYYLRWREPKERKIRVLGRPMWVWRGIVENELKYWLSRAFLPPERWLISLRKRSVSWGKFDESRRW